MVGFLELPVHFLESVCHLLVYSVPSTSQQPVNCVLSESSKLTDILNIRLTCSCLYSLVNNSPLLLSRSICIETTDFMKFEKMASHISCATKWSFVKLYFGQSTDFHDASEQIFHLKTILEINQSIFRDGLRVLNFDFGHIGDLFQYLASLLCKENTTIKLRGAHSLLFFKEHFSLANKISLVNISLNEDNKMALYSFKNLRQLELLCTPAVAASRYETNLDSVRTIRLFDLLGLDVLLSRGLRPSFFPSVTVLHIHNDRVVKLFHSLLGVKQTFPNLIYLELDVAVVDYDEEPLDLIPESCKSLKTTWFLFRLLKPSKNVDELCLFVDAFPFLYNRPISLEAVNVQHLKKMNFVVNYGTLQSFRDASDVPKFFRKITKFIESLIENGIQLEVLSVYLTGACETLLDDYLKKCQQKVCLKASDSQLKVLIVGNKPLLLRDSIDASLMSRMDFLDTQMSWKIRKQNSDCIVFDSLL